MTFETAAQKLLKDKQKNLETIARTYNREKRDRNKPETKKLLAQLYTQAPDLYPHLIHSWAETTKKIDSSFIKETWQDTVSEGPSYRDLFDTFQFTPDMGLLDQLPPYSVCIRIRFRWRKPYISRDDNSFYIIENPVRKEKVFRLPMVAATSWKGAMRAALWQNGYTAEDEQIQRLFGYISDQAEGNQGCLSFYPSYFSSQDIDLEVINPHTRESGISDKGPLQFECVRANTLGEFFLTYTPRDPNLAAQHLRQDLPLIALGCQDMLLTYGVGAKTSVGYGITHNKGKQMRAEFGIQAHLPTLGKDGWGEANYPVHYTFSSITVFSEAATIVAKKIKEGK